MTYLGTQPRRTDLEMMRGDDGAAIVVTHALAPSSASDFSEVRFTVRDRVDGDIVLALTKTLHAGRFSFGSGTITITPTADDTDGKLCGRHVYDIEATPSSGAHNGKVVTVQTGTFHLIGDISNDLPGPTGIDESNLLWWAVAEAYQKLAITYHSTYTDIEASAIILWPDGSMGEYVATDINTTWGLVDGYTLTHTNSGVTITQDAVTRNSNGYITVKPELQVTGSVIGGATATTAVLKAWVSGGAYQKLAITYNTTYPDAEASAEVLWPDGSGGTYTATTINSTWGLVDAYTVTHTLSGRTVTQTAVTRNASGLITATPPLTVN